MISGAGVNITVHVGKYGVLLVDTPRPADVHAGDGRDQEAVEPSAAVGDQHEQQSGARRRKRGARRARSAGAQVGARPSGSSAWVVRPWWRTRTCSIGCRIRRQGATPATPDALPTTTYFLPSMDFSNGEAIVLYHQPAAHTDSDSLVLFRGSDVISTGAIFTPGRYPVIDLAGAAA